MDTSELTIQLCKLPTRQLIAAMRFLNGGPLGFDYMKKTKSDLQSLAVQMALKYAHASHPGEGFESTLIDVVEALKNDKRVTGTDGSVGSVSTKAAATQRLLDALLSSGDWAEGSGDAGGAGGGGEGDKDLAQPDGPASEGEGGKDRETLNKSKGAAGDKDGKGDGDKPEDGKGKGEPRKAPTTPQEMMAEALRQMLEADKPQEKGVDQKTLEKMIQAEMEKRANVYRVEVKHNDPLIPDFKDEEKPRHEIFKRLLRAIMAGRNVLLVGPAGCGKTTLARDAFKAAGLEFGFTGAVAQEHKLLGFVKPDGTLVRTQYRDRYEYGGGFLFDEADASGAQPFLSFNAGLDNGIQDFPDTSVVKHESTVFIAAANTWGHGSDRQYVGRNQLDGATLDRFYAIEMDYDESFEYALFGKSEWVLFVQAARKATRKLGIRHIVSMRAIRDGLVMLKAGEARKDVETSALWKHLRQEDVSKIKATMMGGV